MTTLMMPSDYGVEMFLGSSPVLTSGYLATQPFIHDYPRLQPTPLQTNPLQSTPLHSLWGHHASTTNPQSCSSSSSSSLNNNFKNMLENPSSFSCASSYSSGLMSRGSFRRYNSRRSPSKKKEEPQLRLQPIKSCLVARQDEVEEGAVSPTRLKKKVVFADDQGHPLTHIRVLTERSDCPPRWTADFLEQVTGGAKAEAVADQWELAFPQPASDYLGMRQKLEKENVSLENVIIQEAENRIVGTVKVRNLSYHKEVSIRYTTDHWTTHEDVQATFVPSTSTTGGSYDIYDNFSFVLPLPSSSQADKLEFCVCYQCDHVEYWDNNSNKNYVIVSFRPKKPSNDIGKPEDVYDVSMDSWSEFASWNNLSISDSPYW